MLNGQVNLNRSAVSGFFPRNYIEGDADVHKITDLYLSRIAVFDLCISHLISNDLAALHLARHPPPIFYSCSPPIRIIALLKYTPTCSIIVRVDLDTRQTIASECTRSTHTRVKTRRTSLSGSL